VGSRHALIAPSTTATLAFAASVDFHPRARPCMRPWVEANGYGGPTPGVTTPWSWANSSPSFYGSFTYPCRAFHRKYFSKAISAAWDCGAGIINPRL
jgi:hypothetical protein